MIENKDIKIINKILIREQNSKLIFIELDEILTNSLNEGNIHFSITINFKKNINKIEILENKVEELKKLIIKEIQLWSWHHIESEYYKENNNYHLHIILAVRSLIGYNDVIKNNILYLIRNNYEKDTKIDVHWDFKDTKIWWNYVLKEYTQAYKEKYIEDNKNKKKHKKEINMNGKFSLIECISNQTYLFKNIKDFFDINEYNNINENKKELNELKGTIVDYKKYDFITILYFWDYYIILNNLFVYKNNLYKKVEDYIISYEQKEKLEFLYDEFDSKVFSFFYENFPIHFENFKISRFKPLYLINKEEKLKKFYEFTTRKIKPDFSIMEFKDGIYSILHDKFIRKDKFDKTNKKSLEEILRINKICTIKFYNITYEHIEEPKIWLKGLSHVLSIPENDLKIKKNNKKKDFSEKIAEWLKSEKKKDVNKDLLTIWIYIAYIFHYASGDLNKKKSLFIEGQSNTGKTTLITNPIISFFGKENIGTWSANKNFELQNLNGKILIIVDEAKKITQWGELLKIASGEFTYSESKGKAPEILEPLPLLMLSNHGIEEILGLRNLQNIIDQSILDKSIEETLKAVNNRFEKLKFTQPIPFEMIDKNIHKKLKEEEPKIIIHCNKAYFNWIRNGKKTRMNYKKLIEEIKNNNK